MFVDTACLHAVTFYLCTFYNTGCILLGKNEAKKCFWLYTSAARNIPYACFSGFQRIFIRFQRR